MEESLTSISDARITSLITTSITDMVRQEVGKIMEELNMPVCNETIDRIIAENLDKEVEKQNFVKTYKRKVNQLNQYKCIEKRVDPDELVITNLKLIESRVKRLEDFVIQNLMQRPQLMQDLAGRSVDSLSKKSEGQLEEMISDEKKTEELNNNALLDNKMELGNESLNERHEKFKPPLLNLDDVMKVIKECPETQDSFDIFQSAAERIKLDLERFIQDYKRDLGEKARRRGNSFEDADLSSINSPEVNITKSPETVNNMEATENISKIENSLKPSETVTLITSLKDGSSADSYESALTSTDSDDLKMCEPDDHSKLDEERKQENEKHKITKPVGEEALKCTRPKKDDTKNELKPEKTTVEKFELRRAEAKKIVSFAQQLLSTSKASGDKRSVDKFDIKDMEIKSLQGTKSFETARFNDIQHAKSENEVRECKECQERMKFTNEKSKPCAIDDDIKWKLDKILDQIGDFCNRSKGGKEPKSEPELKFINLKAYETQPGTSTEFTKRKATKGHATSKGRQDAFKSATTNGRGERKKIDKMMDQFRHVGHNTRHVYKVQEVVVTDVKSKAPDQSKVKSKKLIDQPRKSVEAFKTKWGAQYSKNMTTKPMTEPAKTAQKIGISARNIEVLAKPQMKKRIEVEPMTIPLQKSSTTLMLESIDEFARSAAIRSARMARAMNDDDNDISWVYSKRAPPKIPQVNLNELPRTKVLYHNYKL